MTQTPNYYRTFGTLFHIRLRMIRRYRGDRTHLGQQYHIGQFK